MLELPIAHPVSKTGAGDPKVPLSLIDLIQCSHTSRRKSLGESKNSQENTVKAMNMHGACSPLPCGGSRTDHSFLLLMILEPEI